MIIFVHKCIFAYVIICLENRKHSRWQKIHTMDDAKIALKMLFKHTAENRRKQCTKEFKYNELLVCDLNYV